MLHLGTSSCHSFELFNLKNATSIESFDFPLASLTELLELLIHVEKQLLDLHASVHVLWIEARTDAEMEWFF